MQNAKMKSPVCINNYSGLINQEWKQTLAQDTTQVRNKSHTISTQTEIFIKLSLEPLLTTAWSYNYVFI